MRIGVLLQSAEAIRRLRRSVPAGPASAASALDLHQSWDRLLTEGKAGRFEVCVVDPWFAAPADSPEVRLLELERLKKAAGEDVVVLYLPRADAGSTALADLGSMGFPFLLTQDIDDDAGSILRALARSFARSRVRRAWTADRMDLPDAAGSILLEAVAGWPPAGAVHELAARLMATESTLRRTCRELGLQPPRTLLRWSRALEAVALRSLGMASRGRIAHLVDLADSSSLVRLIEDLTGRPLPEIWSDPDLERVLGTFASQIQRGTG